MPESCIKNDCREGTGKAAWLTRWVTLLGVVSLAFLMQRGTEKASLAFLMQRVTKKQLVNMVAVKTILTVAELAIHLDH
jgi:hypothetical protein